MNPRRLTPSMTSLLAFEASARAESFTKAAQQLSLTQSAVSRQVQSLEDLLGVPLFQRIGRHVLLTEVGLMYLREVTPALERIRNASLQAIAFQSGGGTLHLSVLPTFGAKWLMLRLPGFYASHPEILVHVHSKAYRDLDLKLEGMDAAIVVGDGQWDGVSAFRLIDESIVPIISPKRAKQDKIKTVSDLLRCPLLQIASRPTGWQDWLRKHGGPNTEPIIGPRFELTSHLIQAVSAGMGVGLVARVLVEDELLAGTLVVPIEVTDDIPEKAYYLIVSKHRESYPPFATFKEWLLELT